MDPPLFPLFLDLRGRTVLVVGGGAVAARKAAPLLEAGADVRVVAPLLAPPLAEAARNARLRHIEGRFHPRWLDGAWLVVAATDDEAVNREVADAAAARRIWANIVDDGELSSAQMPARVRRGALQVAVSSGGAAPMLARHVREQLERQLDDSVGEPAALLGASRQRIRARYPRPAERRRFVDRVLAGEVPRLLRAGRRGQAHELFQAQLDAPLERSQGSVALVGAGPGDPGLLTLRALRLLNTADVIVHDALVSPEVLQLARRDAEFLDVGKRAGGKQTPQSQINETLLAHARAGRQVVRLKGGDPFVFGRGGEELEFLRQHDIAFEVVPGITAALACAAYAGIPLTHRGVSRSLRFLTARDCEGEVQLDWKALAAESQTLAVYMGVSSLAGFGARLLEHSMSPDTPFALVENGSRPEQRVVLGVLPNLAARARAEAVRTPALLIVGDVAVFAESLHWFGAPPSAAVSSPCAMRRSRERAGSRDDAWLESLEASPVAA